MDKFSISTSIYFGQDSLNKLTEITGKRVLIVCDGFMKSSGMVNIIEEKLSQCEVDVFSDIVPDPPVEVIAQGLQKLKAFNAQIIVAFGGGSSIDAAKAIREYSKKVLDNACQIEEFIAIPTTSGTGSEVTEYAVITNKAEGLKYALADESLLPTMAILDPSLVKSVPKSITADTGMDVITHALEAYVAKGANDFSDALAEKALSLAFKYLPIAFADGNNLEAREKVHNASCLAGMAFNQAGLGITHSLAHAIGGKLHISHGRSNAIILPYVIEFNSKISNKTFTQEYELAAQKYQRIAKLLDLRALNVNIGVNSLVTKIKELKKELMIPETFVAHGVDVNAANEAKEEILNAAMNDICTKANPVDVTKEELKVILDKVIG